LSNFKKKRTTGKPGVGTLSATGKLAGIQRLQKSIRDRTSKLTDKRIEALEGLNSLDEAVADGAVNRVSALLSAVAKGIGKESGMLTNQDIQRVFLENLDTLLTKIKAFVKSNPDEQFPPNVLGPLRRLSASARRQIGKGAVRLLTESRNQFRRGKDLAPLGITEKEVDGFFQEKIDRFTGEEATANKIFGTIGESQRDLGKKRQSVLDKIKARIEARKKGK